MFFSLDHSLVFIVMERRVLGGVLMRTQDASIEDCASVSIDRLSKNLSTQRLIIQINWGILSLKIEWGSRPSRNKGLTYEHMNSEACERQKRPVKGDHHILC